MATKLTELNLAPCGDYVSHALNSFLLELSKDLTDDDLKGLLFLCKGKHGLRKAKLEQIKCSLDLFDYLREKELLNEMNIITLQYMLWALPRQDLQKKYIKFAESLGAIHFVVPKETPENGYEYVKFHIAGTDLENYNKEELEKLRTVIASILLVPPNFVIISGIESSSSLLITIMLLEDDAQRLASASPEALAVLSDVFVDYIMIGTRTIQVSAATKPVIGHPPTESRIEKELREVLVRESQTERELDRAHKKISMLQSELTTARSASQSTGRLFYLLVVLIQQLDEFCTNTLKIKKAIEDQAFNPIDKLQKLCVFTYFRHCLGKVRKLGYNEDIIYNLLDAQAMVIQWHKHERKDVEIANLKRQLALTSWEREKLAYYHKLGVQDKVMSQRDEFCFFLMMQNIPFNVIIGERLNLSQECLEQLFRRLSHDVTESDLKILNKQHKINGQPDMTAYDYLMATYNQRKDRPQGVDLRSFVNDVLVTPLNRPGLLQNLERYVSEIIAATQNPQQSRVPSKKSRKQKAKPAVVAHRGKQSFVTVTKKATGSRSTPEPQQENLREMNERLRNIEKILQESGGSTYGKFNKDPMLNNYDPFLNSNQLFSSFLQGKYASLNPSVSRGLE